MRIVSALARRRHRLGAVQPVDEPVDPLVELPRDRSVALQAAGRAGRPRLRRAGCPGTRPAWPRAAWLTRSVKASGPAPGGAGGNDSSSRTSSFSVNARSASARARRSSALAMLARHRDHEIAASVDAVRERRRARAPAMSTPRSAAAVTASAVARRPLDPRCAGRRDRRGGRHRTAPSGRHATAPRRWGNGRCCRCRRPGSRSWRGARV